MDSNICFSVYVVFDVIFSSRWKMTKHRNHGQGQHMFFAKCIRSWSLDMFVKQSRSCRCDLHCNSDFIDVLYVLHGLWGCLFLHFDAQTFIKLSGLFVPRVHFYNLCSFLIGLRFMLYIEICCSGIESVCQCIVFSGNRSGTHRKQSNQNTEKTTSTFWSKVWPAGMN